MDASFLIQNLTEQKKQIIIGSALGHCGHSHTLSGISSRVQMPRIMPWQRPQLRNGKLLLKMIISIKACWMPLRTVPSLEKKYEASIAQKLLDTQTRSSLNLGQPLSQPVKEDVPFHTNFALTSLLIEQGSFQRALENAVALKEQMGEFLPL